MFSGCGGDNFETLNLGNNFDTSKVTDMTNMFGDFGGQKFEVLNLGSKFNTRSVKNMSGMFNSMPELKTIISPSFDTTSAINTSSMFINDTKLVGGAGTTYDTSHINIEYARIDGGPSSPGYFTAP